MKFGRLLKTTSLDLPEMEALFSAYKTLKKHVKRLPYKEQLGQHGTLDNLSEEENNFCKALSGTLHQLNDMFLTKEETSVIRVERLEHDLAAATTPEQLNDLHKQFVDFHGEVLLLVHWSILAYTATVKILKKHHKRTGLLVKAPQLGNLLSQPFCSTELMTSIAHRVEEDIQRLAERMGVSGQRSSEPTQQQQQQQPQQNAAVAAVAAAAASAGVDLPQISNGGLDLQLLQRLADSGSVTSQSDTELLHEEDTAHTGGSKRTRHHHQQQQQQQECSQQAHLQDGGTVSEVRSGSKRRRVAAAAEDTTSEAAVEGGCSTAAAAAADHADSAEQQEQQVGLQEDPAQQAEHTEAADAADAPAGQQQRLPAASALVPQHRCSSTGCSTDEQQQQQQLQELEQLQHQASVSGCSSCARQGSIMRQTQVALTTWRHLQLTASTPSTVVPNYQLLHHSSTVLTESSAV